MYDVQYMLLFMTLSTNINNSFCVLSKACPLYSLNSCVQKFLHVDWSPTRQLLIKKDLIIIYFSSKIIVCFMHQNPIAALMEIGRWHSAPSICMWSCITCTECLNLQSFFTHITVQT
jgi:hypothetical protein